MHRCIIICTQNLKMSNRTNNQMMQIRHHGRFIIMVMLIKLIDILIKPIDIMTMLVVIPLFLYFLNESIIAIKFNSQ